jgi:HK97 family phage major capsid protein
MEIEKIKDGRHDLSADWRGADHLFRFSNVDVASADDDEKTIQVCFSSEELVLRKATEYDEQIGIAKKGAKYWELLSHRKGDCDFSGLDGGKGTVLDEHENSLQLGKVPRARRSKDSVGRAVLKFDGLSELSTTRYEQMKRGERTGISTGYWHTKFIADEGAQDGYPIKRMAWAADEISSVRNAADKNRAGVRRSAEGQWACLNCGDMFDRDKLDENFECGCEADIRAKRSAIEGRKARKSDDFKFNRAADHFNPGGGRSTQSPQTRNIKIIMENENISEIQNQHDAELVARADAFIKDWPHLRTEILIAKTRALSEGTSYRTFGQEIFRLLQSKPAPANLMQECDMNLGMSGRDIGRFSFQRALRSLSENGKVGGYELELSQAVEKKCGRQPEGFFIPTDVLLRGSARQLMRRDMQATDFPTGGATVGTTIMPTIELLRNKTVVTRLGATVLSGLTSNLAFPIEASPATAQSVSETGALVSSNLTFQQLILTPHRAGVTVTFSKQLIFQSAPDIESLIINDMMEVIGIFHDRLFLSGTGAIDQPLGLLNTPGIGSVYFGGATTFQKLIAFETQVGQMNADRGGKLAYVTTPGTRGVYKGTARALTGATTVSSRALWEDGNFNDGSNDGLVNGYRAASTNQIPGDAVIYGAWNDFICAYFGGFDVVYDPYTSAKQAQINLTVNTWIDCGPRHPQSFVRSADAGSQ